MSARHTELSNTQLTQQEDVDDPDWTVPEAKPMCHGAHHNFDGIIHVLKAKNSRMRGEKDWQDLLKLKLETDFHGFRHAVETAQNLMNAGLLCKVSRELNPDNKKSLMIHRVRTVCDEILMPYVNKDDPDCQNRLMTDKEFKNEVSQMEIIKNTLNKQSESVTCSSCTKQCQPREFLDTKTMMWKPIYEFKNLIPKAPYKHVAFCSDACEEKWRQGFECPKCGENNYTTSKSMTFANVNSLMDIQPILVQILQHNEKQEKAAQDKKELSNDEIKAMSDMKQTYLDRLHSMRKLQTRMCTLCQVPMIPRTSHNFKPILNVTAMP